MNIFTWRTVFCIYISASVNSIQITLIFEPNLLSVEPNESIAIE